TTPGSVQRHKDAVAYPFVECLTQVAFPGRVLDQEHFTRTNDARFAITGGDLYAIIEVDDVLPTGCRVPVQVISRWHFPENDPGRREAFGESPRLRGLDILYFCVSKV